MNGTLADANRKAETRKANRMMMWLTGALGLTTGIGVIAWGAWSMLVTLGLTVYERISLKPEEVIVEDALNQGLLQSATVIALGVIILELRQIAELLSASDADE